MTHITGALLIACGLATRYDPGVMGTVVDNRVRMGQLPPSTDPAYAVALLDCVHLGQPVWVETDTGHVVRAVVADCAQAKHRDSLAERGWAVDLAYELAVKLGAVDAPLAGVCVWDGPPRGYLWRR